MNPEALSKYGSVYVNLLKENGVKFIVKIPSEKHGRLLIITNPFI